MRSGSHGVILTLDIPDDQILWSDFSTWHYVLGGSPIVDNNEEWEIYLNNKDQYPVKKTWKKIFDFEYLRNGNIQQWHGPFNEEWIQGVTPRITMEQVKKVRRFIAK